MNNKKFGKRGTQVNGKYYGRLEMRWNEHNDERLERMEERRLKRSKLKAMEEQDAQKDDNGRENQS